MSAPSPSTEGVDFSLAESIRRLATDDDPRCGHCSAVLATIGLCTGDMFAVENRRDLSGHTKDDAEALFSTSRKLAKLLAAAEPATQDMTFARKRRVMGSPDHVLVVIESPYAGDTERNLAYLRAAMRDSLERGESPYASHGLYTQPGVLDDNDEAERAAGIAAGFAWRQVAGETAVYFDLGITAGMRFGIEDATNRGSPISYRSLGVWRNRSDS